MRSLKTVAALYGLEQNAGYPRNCNRSKTSTTEEPVMWYFELPHIRAVTWDLYYKSNLLL